MKGINYFLLLVVFFLLPGICPGQSFYRLKADITIKEKLPNGTYNLMVGKVYFDINNKKIIYYLSFPEKVTLINTNKYTYVQSDSLRRYESLPGSVDFSVFNLILQGKLDNYGLAEKDAFAIASTEKEGEMTITTWAPVHPKLKELTGNILISKTDKKVNGLVFYNKENQIVSKQAFRKYQNINGLEVPAELITINYSNGKEMVKLTTLENIVINDADQENSYDFVLPVD